MQNLISDRFAKINLKELQELFDTIPPHRSRILDNLIIEIGTEIEKKEIESKNKLINSLLEQKESLYKMIDSINVELEKNK
jgi:hypothetical protein